MASAPSNKPWFVYLLECRDGSLYTGIAVDVPRRMAMHVAGKGARYTRSHPPLRIAAVIGFPDRSSALVAEHRIKQMSVARKRELCLLHPAGSSAQGPDALPGSYAS